MGVSGQGNEGVLTRYPPLVALLLYGPPSWPLVIDFFIWLSSHSVLREPLFE
jgi:hypothetical protein